MESLDKKVLLSFVPRFSGQKVAVVGDVALDKATYGFVDRPNPEYPTAHLMRLSGKKIYVPGCAGNVAANLATLGAKVTIYSAVGLGRVKGADELDVEENLIHNKRFKRAIEEYGVESFLIDEETMEPLVKERFREEEHNGYPLRVDHGESNLQPVSTRTKMEILEDLKAKDISAIVLSDYNKYMFTDGFSQDLINLARARRIPVYADPKPANIQYFTCATMVRPNEGEARRMMGMPKADIKDVIKGLKGRTQCETAIVTRGKKGMVVLSNGDYHEIPTRVREIEEVTGAGDTVIATLTLGLMSGAGIVQAANIANFAAGVVVEKPGTATVTQKELEERILLEN